MATPPPPRACKVEIEKAALEIVEANYGAGRDDLVQAVSRTFGFASTSAQLRAVIAGELERLVANGKLDVRNDMLVMPMAG